MRRESGSSLVEILVALVMLAGGLLAIGTMTVTSLHSIDRSGEETTAMVLSQQRMEWLRNQGYASSALAQGKTSEALADEYSGYTRVTAVVNDDPVADVKRITVVTTSPSGRVVELTSYLAE